MSMISLIANGKPIVAVAGTTLQDFIRQRGLDPRYVVVERNGEPVDRADYERTALEDGDRLELVRAVAGG